MLGRIGFRQGFFRPGLSGLMLNGCAGCEPDETIIVRQVGPCRWDRPWILLAMKRLQRFFPLLFALAASGAPGITVEQHPVANPENKIRSQERGIPITIAGL